MFPIDSSYIFYRDFTAQSNKGKQTWHLLTIHAYFTGCFTWFAPSKHASNFIKSLYLLYFYPLTFCRGKLHNRCVGFPCIFKGNWVGSPWNFVRCEFLQIWQLRIASNKWAMNWHWFGGGRLFIDTWFYLRHSVSCTTTLFLNLQITRSDIRPYIKRAVSLMIVYGYFNLPQGFVWVCMG